MSKACWSFQIKDVICYKQMMPFAIVLQTICGLLGNLLSILFHKLLHQALPSLGFSSQEHWSGLPFPSPMHESEKWRWSHSVVTDSLRRHGLQPTRLLCPWDFPCKNTGVGCYCLLPLVVAVFSICLKQLFPNCTNDLISLKLFCGGQVSV